ncbi:hypothetical protein H4582DRAFT_2070513 [Lactarius indigo]|nr:hypothetical protein H4582DRAFT_2070513 [Lactarius indigo]
MAKKHTLASQPSSGPSMAVPTGKSSQDCVLSLKANLLIHLQGWIDDGMATAFNSEGEGHLVDLVQFKEDVNKKSALDFVGLLREAVKEKDLELWRTILAHDIFYTVMVDDPTSSKET